MASILERYTDKIAGVLGCFDRMMLTGTLPTLCYAEGMTKRLSARRIFERAQEIAESLAPARLHARLDEFARRYCPIFETIESQYHWSLDTIEFATDIVFRRQADLQPLYPELIRTAIHTVKPDDIATFLGRKLHGNYAGWRGASF